MPANHGPVSDPGDARHAFDNAAPELPPPPNHDAAERHGAWTLDDPEPTNLIALWPRRDAPTPNEVRALFNKALGQEVQVVAEPAAPESNIRWLAIFEVPSLPAPLIVWVEAMRSLAKETLDFLGAQKIKWTVGVETALDPADPHSHFLGLLRLLGRALNQSPGILNVNIGNWFLRKELEETILRQDIEPTADILWVVHALRPNEKPEAGDTVWLFTQGLWRCSLPELEMLEVPFEHSGAAFDLLGSIAHLVVGEQLPKPGESLEIGPGLQVTFRPWRQVAAQLDPNGIGGLNHRKQLGYGTDRGVRAVVCGTRPDSTHTKLWTWPAEVVAAIESATTAVYRTMRWTQRQERLARSTWTQLREAFARLPQRQTTAAVGSDEEPVFLVKAGFVRSDAPLNDPAADREHLWFQVLEFDGDRAQARLMNRPRCISAVNEGDVRWLGCDVISDWQVMTRLGVFGPGRADDMRLAIEALVQEQLVP